MNLFNTDNYLQNNTTAIKNRLMLYLEQPVIYKNKEYPPGEIMLLSFICDSPGITSSELANKTNRTRGTISIAMKKMIEKDLVYFKDSHEHRKRKHIFPTDLGEEVNAQYKLHDEYLIENLKKVLSEKCSDDELKLLYSATSEITRLIIHNTRRKDL